ncbi:MAG: hypothetical protein WCJ45_02415 [bacterium]
MPIIISLAIHLKKFGIHSSEHDQSRRSDTVADDVMEIVIFAEGRGIERDIELFDGLYADKAIFSSSESDHREG